MEPQSNQPRNDAEQGFSFLDLIPGLPLRRRRRFTPSYREAPATAPAQPVYTVFDYNAEHLQEKKLPDATACKAFVDNQHVTWINVDGLAKEDVVMLCQHFGVHELLVSDILTIGQRAKMDELGEVLFAVLPMLYYNEVSGSVETEQVSLVLGSDFVLSFQEEPERDAFDRVRERLRKGYQRLRRAGPDYLFYELLDVIVDEYFLVMDKLADRIERLEERLLEGGKRVQLSQLSLLRREVMFLRRNVQPVRELLAGLNATDSELIAEKTEKYFKDVLDHTQQAHDYAEAQRDMMMNLQDLFLNQTNLRLNEVIKVFTIITTLLAPATVIGGIFGMNFDVIPLSHQQMGFWIAVAGMLIIPVVMLYWFRKKGWF